MTTDIRLVVSNKTKILKVRLYALSESGLKVFNLGSFGRFAPRPIGPYKNIENPQIVITTPKSPKPEVSESACG